MVVSATAGGLPFQNQRKSCDTDGDNASKNGDFTAAACIPDDDEEEVFFDHETIKAVPSIEIPHESLGYPFPKVGLIFMDSFSPYHGEFLVEKAKRVYNAGIVQVLSGYMTEGIYRDNDIEDHMSSRIPNIGKENAWASDIPFEILNIYCESDAGLPSAERLGVALGLARSDGVNPARRNKFLMNMAASSAGLATVSQKMCSTLEDALSFASGLGVGNDENSKRCIVKPARGVASDSVLLCDNLSDVKESFNQILGMPVYGSPYKSHQKVLVQEHAIGVEYAVDIVSKDGEHKVAALWKYDKRPVNGAPFVYHATMLADANTEEGKVACQYAMAALDAVGYTWGLSHVEVMIDSKLSAKLIEINCRQHNTDFAPMTTACIGYNALDMLLSAYFYEIPDSELPFETADERLNWDAIPVFPKPAAFGAIVHLVCHAEGVVTEINGIDEIIELESTQILQLYPGFSPGNYVEKTIDIRTDSGFVHLINSEESEFTRDYERILQIMPDMFTVEEN